MTLIHGAPRRKANFYTRNVLELKGKCGERRQGKEKRENRGLGISNTKALGQMKEDRDRAQKEKCQGGLGPGAHS